MRAVSCSRGLTASAACRPEGRSELSDATVGCPEGLARVAVESIKTQDKNGVLPDVVSNEPKVGSTLCRQGGKAGLGRGVGCPERLARVAI